MTIKDKIRVLVTDSGLGGLSVVADIVHKFKANSFSEKLNLIFADALFDENSGYNKLTDKNEKITILNKALFGLEKNLSPDIILIACNTLSVLYPYTEFASKSKTKTIGIVEFGVNLIFSALARNEKSQVIIFATETTINSNAHKKELLQKGINEDRIVTKACPSLQSYIERNPQGIETKALINLYVNEVLEQIVDTDNLYISFNCTHYGYSLSFWREVFIEKGIKLLGILDPNTQMSNVLYSKKVNNKSMVSEMSLKVVSKVKMENQNQIAMMKLFENETPELTKAIANYEFNPDLF